MLARRGVAPPGTPKEVCANSGGSFSAMRLRGSPPPAITSVVAPRTDGQEASPGVIAGHGLPRARASYGDIGHLGRCRLARDVRPEHHHQPAEQQQHERVPHDGSLTSAGMGVLSRHPNYRTLGAIDAWVVVADGGSLPTHRLGMVDVRVPLPAATSTTKLPCFRSATSICARRRTALRRAGTGLLSRRSRALHHSDCPGATRPCSAAWFDEFERHAGGGAWDRDNPPLAEESKQEWTRWLSAWLLWNGGRSRRGRERVTVRVL
jgi:hypothetical protein